MARTYGAYADHTAVAPGVKTEPLARIPDSITDEQAAALPIPAITALGSLELLDVTTKQRVVVMGAAGGVGGYAVQMARSFGAHVIATVRGDVDEARRLGAEEVFDNKSADAVDAIYAAYPDGVDAVLDLVNGPDAIRRDAGYYPARRAASSPRSTQRMKRGLAGTKSTRTIFRRSRIRSRPRKGSTKWRAWSRTARYRSLCASAPRFRWNAPGKYSTRFETAASAAKPSSASSSDASVASFLRRGHWPPRWARRELTATSRPYGAGSLTGTEWRAAASK